jgi:hypothetical protein
MQMKAVLLLVAVSCLAQQKDNGLGTWLFVPEKSTYESGPAPKESKRQWVAKGDTVQFLHDGRSADGKVFHTEFTAKYDNRAVPFIGGTLYNSVALKVINPNVVEQTFFLDGKVTVRASRTISADGKSMTIDSRGQKPDGSKFRNLLVYRRLN